MYKIGELSRLCSLPVKTLRYYDDIGLLVPDRIDKFTGYRYYSPARLGDCYRILALKELGFTLDEIRSHMEQGDTTALLTAKKEELAAQIAETEEKLRRLENIISMTTEGEKTMIPMVIRNSETIKTVCLRRVFSGKEEARQAMENLYEALPPSIRGKRRVLINYETVHKETDLDLGACVEITGCPPADFPYPLKTLDFTGDTATLVCSRENLEEACRDMIRQLHEYPAQIVGAFYEIDYGGGTVELKVPVCRLTKDTVFQSEEMDLPFVNDPAAVGKWKMLDIVPSKEQFLYGYEKCPRLGWLDELYFLEGGQPYWSVMGWTKGYLYTHGSEPQTVLKNRCEIETAGGHTLLYLYMKHYRDGQGLVSGMPEVWVYEKVDSISRSAHDIRRTDRIDYPFVPDDKILGKWKVRDFYSWKFEENFDPGKQNYPSENLFAKEMDFQPGGICLQTTKQHTSRLRWTKGMVLNPSAETASAYEIRVIGGTEYLICEWKTGDYQYGSDARIYWYVFTR